MKNRALPLLPALFAASAALAAPSLSVVQVSDFSASLSSDLAPEEGETLFVAIGPSPSLLSRTNSIPSQLRNGRVACDLHGLAPNAYHAVRLLAWNANGEWRGTVTACFWTRAEYVPSFTGTVGEPGAMQGVIPVAEGGAPDFSTTIETLRQSGRDAASPSVTRVAGAIMAGATSTATDPVSGATFEWEKGRCFYYECYLYLEAQEPVFLRSQGARCTAWIDYRELLTTNGPAANFAANGVARFSPSYAGWHPVRLFLWDPQGGPGAPRLPAVQYAVGESAATNLVDDACWRPFLDPGDGSRLRTGRGMPPAIEIAAHSISNHVLSAKLLFHNGADRFNLRAYYGPGHAGSNEEGWPNVYSFKALDPDTRSFTVKMPLPHGARHLRFGAYVYQGRVTSWSRSLSLDPALPEFGNVAFSSKPETSPPSLTTSLLGLGIGNASVALSLEYGETEALGSSLALGERSGPCDIAAPLPDDAPKGACWASFCATLPDGRRVRTVPLHVDR